MINTSEVSPIGRFVQGSQFRLPLDGNRFHIFVMQKRPLLLAIVFFCLCMVGYGGPKEVIHDAKTLVIVSAINPRINGMKVGVTVFQNGEWKGEEPGFDLNTTAVEQLKKALNRPAPVYNGRDCNFVRENDPAEDGSSSKADQKILSEKAASWGADVVLLVKGGRKHDWLSNSSRRLEDTGVIERGIFVNAFCVLDLFLFETKSGSYQKVTTAYRGQRTPRIDWHDEWKSYDTSSKRIMLDGIRSALAESLTDLLSKVALTDAPAGQRSFLQKAHLAPQGKSWIPEGKVIPLLEGLSSDDVRRSVLLALRKRGWNVISDEPNTMVANLIEKRKEAIETITFSATGITLTPERFELKANGERVRIEPQLRWDRNLKESIISTMYDLVPVGQ